MKVVIPTGWHEVTVSQFIKIAEVPKLGFDETDSNLRILSILTGVDDTYFTGVELPQLKKIFQKISFISTKPEGLPLKQKVMINGRRYRVNYLPSTITAGEYIDISHYTKDANANLPKILAIYLKPVNFLGFKRKDCYKKVEGKYVQTLESREWTEKHLPDVLTMDVVFPMSSFFLKLWQRLINDTKVYFGKVSEKKIKELRKQVLDLQKNGGGT
jgi:hypothetical protein